MAVPMASSAKVVTFVGFRPRVASFHVAGVALGDISTCFIACQNSSCVAGAILWQRFQKMRCIFRGRRSTLVTISRGRRSTLDFRRVILRVFANRSVRSASSGDKVQIAWQVWHFVRCDEN